MTVVTATAGMAANPAKASRRLGRRMSSAAPHTRRASSAHRKASPKFNRAFSQSSMPTSPRMTLLSRLMVKQAVSTATAGRRCSCNRAAARIPFDSQTATASKVATLQ